MLLNGMNVKIQLTHRKDTFCPLNGEANQQCKAQIMSVSLFVKHVKVSPGVQLGHPEAPLTSNAKYPIKQVDMKVFSIPAGSPACNQENLFGGQLPKQPIIAFVENTTFSST